MEDTKLQSHVKSTIQLSSSEIDTLNDAVNLILHNIKEIVRE